MSLQIIHGWPNKYNTRILQFFCKLSILAQESISWVYSIDPIRNTEIDDCVDVEVGRHRRLVR